MSSLAANPLSQGDTHSSPCDSYTAAAGSVSHASTEIQDLQGFGSAAGKAARDGAGTDEAATLIGGLNPEPLGSARGGSFAGVTAVDVRNGEEGLFKDSFSFAASPLAWGSFHKGQDGAHGHGDRGVGEQATKTGFEFQVGDCVHAHGSESTVDSIDEKFKDGPIAIVKGDKKSDLIAIKDVAQLEHVTGTDGPQGRKFIDREGNVFAARLGADLDDPKSSDFVHMQKHKAVALDQIGFVRGDRDLSQGDIAKIQAHGASYPAGSTDRAQYLSWMQSAPEFVFNNVPSVSLPADAHFNPTRGSVNCMACTAAVFKSQHDGQFVSAADIGRLAMADGSKLGDPYPGKFASEMDAQMWMENATGASLSKSAAFETLEPNKDYALFLPLQSTPGSENWHVVNLATDANGHWTAYDGQSGMKMNNQSVLNYAHDRGHRLAEFQLH